MLKNKQEIMCNIVKFLQTGIYELKQMNNDQAEKHNGLRECRIDDSWGLTFLHDIDEDGKYLWCEIVLSIQDNGKYDDILEGFALDIEDDIYNFACHIINQIEIDRGKKTYLTDEILYIFEDNVESFGGELLDKFNYCQVYAVHNSDEDKKEFPYSVFAKLFSGEIIYIDDITKEYFDELNHLDI